MTPAATVVETRVGQCDRHGHGEYLARQRRDQWTGCPKCIEQDIARQRAEESEQARLARIERALRISEIPNRFADARFDDSVPKRLQEWTEDLIAGTASGPAVLVGGVGTGKTHAACAVLAHCIRTCETVGRFTTPAAFGRQVRDQWTSRERTEGDILKQYAEAPVLILDDLGASRAVDAELLHELICVRYAADRLYATIITSNLSPAKFADAIGERAADRIRQGSVVIPMTGRSRRLPSR